LTEPTTILDYATLQPRRWRITEMLLRFLRLARWFLLQRPLDSAEVAVAGSLAWATLYIFWAARHFELGSNSLKPALSLTWLLPCVVGVALVRIVMRRRWKALLVFALVVAAVAPLAGMVQFERCPHAAYVQILGISIPVEGDACGNPRKVEPWWLRE
jgi:hypothetical protein